MISIDNAKRLQDLGLEHEWAEGDTCFSLEAEKHNVPSHLNPYSVVYPKQTNDSCVWLPTLSQLLSEIGKRGSWCLYTAGDRFAVNSERRNDSPIGFVHNETPAETMEDAAALALIAILEEQQ